MQDYHCQRIYIIFKLVNTHITCSDSFYFIQQPFITIMLLLCTLLTEIKTTNFQCLYLCLHSQFISIWQDTKHKTLMRNDN